MDIGASGTGPGGAGVHVISPVNIPASSFKRFLSPSHVYLFAVLLLNRSLSLTSPPCVSNYRVYQASGYLSLTVP